LQKQPYSVLFGVLVLLYVLALKVPVWPVLGLSPSDILAVFDCETIQGYLYPGVEDIIKD